MIAPNALGPTSYASDYPPKPHERFRPQDAYAAPPPVALEKTTSYAADFPRKAGEPKRVPDRGYLELNPLEPVPAGSATHAQFPGYPAPHQPAYAPLDVPLPPGPAEPVYKPPAPPAPPPPFYAPPSPVAVSSEPTPTSHYRKTLVPHPVQRNAPHASWPPAVATPPAPEKIVVNRPPISAPVGWRLPQNRKALGLQTVEAESGVVSGPDVFHKVIPAGTGPCTGNVTVTTVRDNQETLCVLILHGDSEVASQNEVIGQFDIKSLAPAPAETPRVQIQYTVDNQGFLKVWARELDSNKHKVWLANGGKIVASK